MNSLTKDYEGWTITVYAIAYGVYKYYCSKPGQAAKMGKVEANDCFEAFDTTVKYIDYITPPGA